MILWWSLDLFTCWVVSDSLWPHGLQHSGLPYPSLSPRVCSDSESIESVMPSNHLILCQSPSLPCPQSFPALESFSLSQPFTSGGQSRGVWASASVLPMNIQDWFPLGLTGWIFLLSTWLSRVLSSISVWKHQFFGTKPSLWSNSHIYK